ncbi:MAG TPA: DUF3883 domain-containing protein [Amaricoccus sp.]|uniref:DUF3883 domain-containing protein n=1 Tax=Amaricoccus sp. TaxID=1872485 RepID=UPI002B9BA209|nr:DUF3883 domain-containing protein [Amaricoccus sp.]HMR54500.1 DUF3883 domain-containing protein [Amaricoccus sp.]HMU00793.1 DUF3883 domain-containing protein [Amaricoccus sp.]
MERADIAGSDWSDDEVALIVADYFDMLTKELRGESFVKAQRNAALQELTGRSRGSIEFKHQNISAVLRELGLPWVQGYKPMANYQAKLVGAVENSLSTTPDILNASRAQEPSGFSEDPVLYVEAPPVMSTHQSHCPPLLERLVRKFDPAARDTRNRRLGRQGEECVFRSERARLSQEGRSDLAKRVRWVSEEDGDGAGYDILSFSLAGTQRLLEVKTTPGHQTTPFYVSANEWDVSIERPEAFRIVRLYDFLRQPKAFQIAPPLEDSVLLRPVQFRASF